MRRTWTVGLLPLSSCFILAAMPVGSALAIEIVPVAQSREFRDIHYDWIGERTETVSSAPDFADFDADFGSAGHHVSSIGPDSVSADLVAVAQGRIVNGEVEFFERYSTLVLDFDLVEEAEYLLAGVADVDAMTESGPSGALISLSVFDDGLGSFVPLASWFFDGIMHGGVNPFSQSGLLALGSYRLESRAYALSTSVDGSPMSSEAALEVTLALGQVPEPSTGLLLALGTLVLLRATGGQRRGTWLPPAST